MRLIPTPEMLLAGGSVLLVIAAASWWMLSDEPVSPKDQLTWTGGAVVVQRASLPAIGDFIKEFNVNDEDPFVPQETRAVQVTHIQQGRQPHRPPPRVDPPVTPAPVPRPELTFPPAQLRPPGAPECFGVITLDQGTCVFVRSAASPDTIQLSPGDRFPALADSAHQWTLIGVTEDGLAHFRDPSGKDQLFPIGKLPGDPPPATLAPTPGTGANPPSTPAPAPSTGPGVTPKGPESAPQPGSHHRAKPRQLQPEQQQQPSAPVVQPPITPWGQTPVPAPAPKP